MKYFLTLIVLSALVVSCSEKPAPETTPGTAPGEPDRSALPIKAPVRPKYSQLDVRDATAPPRFDVTAPKGAPNVIVILIDDMGFGLSESFGGPIPMPTFDKLATNGLRYNRFHTTSLCAPTRMALLTGI
ncbi:MAG: sulfatase-like hydrolase/transferase [Cytophagales bacterium]|nr:sulfatase-like hydrolase/transferase [Cytophagales bacterium]